VRILVVSQMYPGPADPDLGVFVAQLVGALAERGHELDLAVLDRRSGGKRRYLELRRKVRRAARPDVVWAHFLVPSGLIATSVEAPLVVTAHGNDVANIGTRPGVAVLTRRVVRRAESSSFASRRRAGRPWSLIQASISSASGREAKLGGPFPSVPLFWRLGH
jgi:hypothetical protein